MDLFETLTQALKPEFINSEIKEEKKPYYNVWVHVEEVTFDENGEEVFTDMDETFMPVKLVKLNSESEVDKAMKLLEKELIVFY